VTEAPGTQPKLGVLLCSGSLLAAAEGGVALLLGGFFDLGRAEPLLFLAFRPWILLAAALIARARPWSDRTLLYAITLLLAFAGESVLLLALGASDPWSGGLRGLLAGAVAALAFDLLAQAGRRLGRAGLLAASAAGLALLLVPGAMRPYEAVVLGPAEPPSGASKPELMLFTALPIIWGERGAFDPNARPAASFRYLEQEFRIRPLDTLDPATLGQGGLLLLAQPRALDPAEFAALDAWVRRGGRVLILTDPTLTWPSDLPLGDIRRPPPIGLLDPLLAHWGLRLAPPVDPGVAVRVRPFRPEGPPRRLLMASVGRFEPTGADCLPGLVTLCRKGAGRAALIADADLLNDALWLPEAAGADLAGRAADNPLILADLLDELAGVQRARAASPIQWIEEGASVPRALLSGLAPLLIAGVAGLILVRVRRS
jgi:hypothetical protein